MGNESSRQKQNSSSSGTNRANPSLPSFSLKSGPSTSVVQRHLDMAKKTRVLQLKGCGMKTVPLGLEETLTIIRSLDLSQNKIRELPSFFFNFTLLKQLVLAENRLTELPDEIGCLKTLELLNISNNELTNLPDTLIGCNLLRNLTATHNKFSSIPLVIVHLPNVVSVDLSNNFIENVPEQIGSLKATELNLNNNRLHTLHPNLAKCSNLKVFRVDENCLQKNQFSKAILHDSRISLISHAGNLFQGTDFQSLPGYEAYQERFTATKRKGV